MNLEERLGFFAENYELIATGAFFRGPKKYIKDGENRLCRFCHKSESDVTFNNTSHAIPEFLGNHQLVMLDECDSCNKFFSEKLENHLDKFTKPYRIAGQIAGKRGIPNYKTPSQKSRIEFSERTGFVIKSQIEDAFLEIDTDQKEMTLNLHQEPFIPLFAYKALVKIAVSLVENQSELLAFKETIDWLQADTLQSVINPVILMQTFIPGPRPTTGVVVALFRRKATVNNVPYSVAVIAFGNVIFQYFVPSIVDTSRHMIVSIPFLPSPFELIDWPYGQPRFSSIDLSGTEKIKKDFPIKYSFDEMVPST